MFAQHANQSCLEEASHPSIRGPPKLEVQGTGIEFNYSHSVPNNTGIDNGFVGEVAQPDSWPWVSVDIPGSPQLSRLFSALNIQNTDTANIIEPISVIEELSLSKHCGNIDEPSNNGITMSTLHPDAIHPHRPLDVSPKYHPLGQILIKSQSPSSNLPRFLYNGSDILPPTGAWVPPSPWNELYPFPSPSYPKQQMQDASSISEVSISSMKSRAYRLQAYIASLANLFPPNHPMILKSMEDLADIFSEMGNHFDSSIWWKRIVATRESAQGAGSLDCLNAMYRLIYSLQEQGDGVLNEVAALERRLDSLISHNLPWEHPVAIGFLVYKARAFSRKENFRKSEEIYRQILQVKLTQLGPGDTETIQTMSSLSLVISKKLNRHPSRRGIDAFSRAKEAKSSEHLMGAAVQLFARSGVPYTTSQGQRIGIHHMALFAELGYLEKAVNVAETGAKRFKRILGESHPTTIEYLEYAGHLYEQQGRYDESIDTFRKVLSLQEVDESMMGHIDRYEGLGKALRGAQQHHEALPYLYKTFHAWHSMFGILNFRTKTACHNLGDSYAHARQSHQALQLFNAYIEEIRATAGNEQPLISEVLGWVNEVEKLFMK